MVLFFWWLRRKAAHKLKNLLENKINLRNSRLGETFKVMLEFQRMMWFRRDWFDLNYIGLEFRFLGIIG